MPPRKKKPLQRTPLNPSKPKGNTKNVTKTTVSTKKTKVVPPKKKAPARKAAPKKKQPIKKASNSLEEIEEYSEPVQLVENNMEVDNDSILVSSKIEVLTDNNEDNSVEYDTSMDSHPIPDEDAGTFKIIEQLENLEVQDEQGVIIEFSCVDNEITLDYNISQEVTLGADSENSTESKIAASDEGVVGEEILQKDETLENSVADVNEVEHNLSVMMNSGAESAEENSLLGDNLPKEKVEECVEKNDYQGSTENRECISSITEDSIDNIEALETGIDHLEPTLEYKTDIQSIQSKIETGLDVFEDVEKNQKLPRIKGKKNETKTTKSQKKEPKKKVSKVKAGKNKIEEVDDSSIRRSSRIKSIKVMKKPSVGHGLVKSKDSDSSEIKNETELIQVLQGTPTITESIVKPIKVKSRWRRSSELEMHVSNAGTPINTIDEKVETSSDKDKAPRIVKDEMVESRLKQFIHLKENSYLTERFICKEAKKMTCDCFLTDEEIARGEMACGEDCLNRLLMIECGNLCQVGERCANKKFHKGQFAPVEVFNTHKKGLGLKAAANIPYGEFILEYVGEVLNAEEFDKRAEEYSKDKNQHYYFMSLRSDAIIDATQKGNISRFINHSCEPNAETQKWTVNGELRIGFFSTRTILAGEEVTFDYRFERYGKEAQKCFCEAPSCRGWLGEEPDEDEEGEEDEEEEEEVEIVPEQVVETVPKVPSSEVSTEEGVKEEIKEEPIVPPVQTTPKLKKPKARRKIRKDIFEDDQLDEEIEVLITTGLKNQAHTLKLSRLMLRAKEPIQRAKLLRVLRRGELPCRRLFLDYHGLRLMHGYMTDTQHLCKIDKKYDSLRLEMLQTLAVLPIPNKTMLQDSKVLVTVEKWSLPASTTSPLDSESNSPKIEPDSPIPVTIITETKENTENYDLDDKQSDDSIRKSVGMYESEMKYSYFTNTSGEALATEIANIFEDDSYVSSPKPKPKIETKATLPNYEEEIISLASKLLEAWSNLKEVFRIPKKERIEQMKEHEREANKGYIAGLGLEQYAEKKNENRYRGMQRSRQQDKKNHKSDDRLQQQVMLSKQNRRKLFALQVEQQEEERRRKQRELWRQHERNCLLIGTDPRFTAPFDPTRGFQCIWNPQTGQWQNYPLPPQNQSSMGYGHMPVQVSLPNTNVPPPNIASSANYPYGVPSLPIPSGLPIGMPPIPTSRSLPHMIPVGRPLPTSAPPPLAPPSLPHQVTPSNVSTMTSNIPHSQAISVLPQIATNIPPPTIAQTPPLLPTGVPNLYQPPSFPPQVMVGQTQSSVLYQQEKKNEYISMIGDVKFMGPIPPPAKLPPKWKCGKDKYGRPYYYHIRIRKSQWEPPPFDDPPPPPPPEPEEESESSSSDSSSSSPDSTSDNIDSDDEIIKNDRLSRKVRKQMEKDFKVLIPVKSPNRKNISLNIENKSSPMSQQKSEIEDSDVQSSQKKDIESSIDKRLKEQFNLLNEDSPPTAKRKRPSLVQEIIISPRSEGDKLQFREDLKRYKENKEMLKRQKEIILQQSKKHIKDKKVKQQQSKAKLREMKYSNAENAKKIRETFRSSMANTVVNALNVYRKSDCKEGRITKTEDFKHLARKLTHFVMLKEMKYISEIEELICSDNVKAKARDYIRKYMSKFGEVYVRRDDEPEHYY